MPAIAVEPTAMTYGHFGRDPFQASYKWLDDSGQEQIETFTAFPWEKTDKAAYLKAAAKL